MAYFLRFDGVNDYVDIPAWKPDSLDFSIELVVTFSNQDVVLGNLTNQNDGFVYLSNGVRFNSGTGYDRTTSLPTGTVFGDRLKIEIFSNPAGTEVYVTNLENEEVSSLFNVQTGTPTFNAIGKFQTGRNLNGDLYYITLNSGSDSRNYDPSASNGTGLILPDTIGNNSGTLVNFPTDNSQWIFYDDGGGAVTVDAAYNVNAPTFTSSASVTLPAPIADASFTLTPPTFTASAGASLPQPIANGAFSIASPSFSASADASLPQPIANTAFTLNAPTFSASATATIPGFSASVSYSVNAPTFAAEAAVTLPQPTSDVTYAVTAPTFSVDSTATLPQPAANAAFSLPEPTFAASATATQTGFNASVNFTLPAPTFSADAVATLPQPIADGNFSITAPAFSVVAIAGGIAIIVDNETNINMPALSTNINAPVLSNNVRI